MEAVRRISFPVGKRDDLGVINTFGFNTNSRGLIPRFSLPPPFLHIRFLIETFSYPANLTQHSPLPIYVSSFASLFPLLYSHKQPSTPFNERLFNEEEQKYPSISSFRRQRKRASFWRRRKQQEKQKSVPKKEGNALKSAIYTYIYVRRKFLSNSSGLPLEEARVRRLQHRRRERKREREFLEWWGS